MTQTNLDLEQAYTGPVHYFASCAFGFALADTREEAIQKLVNGFRRDLTPVVKNAQKNGEPGCYMWSCLVEAPADAEYQISFYAPQGVGVRDGEHHYCTYLTAKQMAYCTTNGAVK